MTNVNFPGESSITSALAEQLARRSSSKIVGNWNPNTIQNAAWRPDTVADDISSVSWRMRALAMRLRIPEGHSFPYQHVSTAWTGEKVFVFVVENNQPVTLEDEAALFPSDALITQLRLIQK